MPDSETTGDVMRRATSCGGWTEPWYNGIRQSIHLNVKGKLETYLEQIHNRVVVILQLYFKTTIASLFVQVIVTVEVK